jgi:hypothetical protein
MGVDMNPKDELDFHLPNLIDFLNSKGIEERYLDFSSSDAPPEKQPRVPTDARSEFLANRAMGDWAENILAESINKSNTLKVSHYGNSERIAAGEDGFKDYYLSALEEVRKFGKRPDLLVFKKNIDVPSDLSSHPVPNSDAFVQKSFSSIEVRSSKFEAQTYMKVRQADKALGKSASNETPSFTVKVEDLRVVYRWISRVNVSQTYCQVFFDSVYAINIKTIFKLIASGKGVKLDNPLKSQLKTTIMIPITSGDLVGVFDKLPEFAVENKISRLGRHDAFVKPVGGNLILNEDKLISVLVGT